MLGFLTYTGSDGGDEGYAESQLRWSVLQEMGHKFDHINIPQWLFFGSIDCAGNLESSRRDLTHFFDLVPQLSVCAVPNASVCT